MKTPTPAVALSVVIACLVSGCGTRVGEDAPTHVDLLPRLEFFEEIRIGSVDDPLAGFTRIGGVRVAENGELYVLEASAKEIRVFSTDGQRLRTIGGPGSGPGEFSSVSAFGLLGDTVWVTNLVQNRISWFDRDGRLLLTTSGRSVPIRLEDSDILISALPNRPLPNGLIESTVMYQGGVLDRPYRIPTLHFTREGEVVDTAGWTMLGPKRTVSLGGRNLIPPSLQPTSPISTVVDGDTVTVQWQDPREGPGILEVIRRDESGDTLYRRLLQYTPVPVPGSVLDSLMEGPLRIASMLDTDAGEMNRIMRPAIELPASRPPVRSVFADREGGAWIELATVSDDTSDWVRIAADGTPVGRVALPAGIQMMWASGPTAWAVASDELEVPWLVRLTVQ